MIDVRFIQDKLAYTYNSAKARMSANPEHTAKQNEIVSKYHFVKPEDAIKKAMQMANEGKNKYQVWAKIEIDEEFYFLSDKWIVTDDIDLLLAAEYIGFYQVSFGGDSIRYVI